MELMLLQLQLLAGVRASDKKRNPLAAATAAAGRPEGSFFRLFLQAMPTAVHCTDVHCTAAQCTAAPSVAVPSAAARFAAAAE